MERVTHYNLSARVGEMAAMTDSLKDSHVFRTFWAQAARAEGTQEEEEEEAAGSGPLLDMEDAYATLYHPCLAKFRKLYEDLKAGELTFGEVRAIFSDFVDKYEDLTSDLRVMRALDPSDPGDWIQERVGQIREYHHLDRSARAAKVILEVKEALGLTGDFSLLDFVLRITDAFENSRGEKLGQINRQVVLAIKLLRDLDEARCQCLQELVLAREFVHWVCEAVEGVNELKVFVDLAFIFAGENDMDVDRVACFHDAVQGYSSLLYKLDTSQGFQAFAGHLKELWKALDSDPHLPSKLRDSARNLGWLKTVKESHGSVERSSLTLARAINSRGTYVIQAPAEGQQISPDGVLRLLLPESHKGRQELRSYSLEELKELMNKLMLMSGKKDHNSADVEEFSEVFCNVRAEVRAFLNLYSAGSFLFRAWKVQVHCGQPEPVRMHFPLPLVCFTF
ncbi:Protein ALO17 [Myotis davidii]|uniref:Protein ALO17 n=1 Tax=Myotis davidii TaxID=225400 RepID=L5MJ28_MYODS|nr:Protein ALO17 [Myotis davidii]